MLAQLGAEQAFAQRRGFANIGAAGWPSTGFVMCIPQITWTQKALETRSRSASRDLLGPVVLEATLVCDRPRISLSCCTANCPSERHKNDKTSYPQ